MTVDIEERALRQAACELDKPAQQPSPIYAGKTPMNGQFRRLGIRTGLEFSAYDIKLKDTFKQKISSPPGLTICVMQQASGCSILQTMDEKRRQIRLEHKPRSALMIFSKTSVDGEYVLPPGAHFRGIEIRASKSFLKRLDVTKFFEKAVENRQITEAAADGLWVGRFPANKIIATLTSNLMTSGLDVSCEDLAIEARCLDLLREAVSAVRKPPMCQTIKILRDSRKLNEAKDLLLCHLDRSWTIQELACCVGLSEKRLKDGFRQLFGVPVYSFLQKSRMEEARTLLTLKGATVTETSLAVGYTNPSRFSQLFLREYGMSPSSFIRTTLLAEHAKQ